MRRWRQIPGLYRLLMIFFGAIDVVVLAVVAAGLRSWLHAGESVLLTIIFLLLMYPLFATVPSRAAPFIHERFRGIAGVVSGLTFLVLSV